MNALDFTNLGGFPLEQDTLKFMQDAYGDLFAGMAAMAGEKAILAGVSVNGSNVSDGWIVHNGEILRFVGGTIGAGVVVSEATAPATFEDGSTKQVFKTRFATIGSPATFAFAELKRVGQLQKPQAYISYTASAVLGNIGSGNANSIGLNDSLFNIVIPDQGGTGYIITGSLVGQSTNPDDDNDVMWIVHSKMATGFKLVVHEAFGNAQNLSFDFAIIKNF